MKVEVQTTSPPPQRVLLDLSVEEFALIFRLYFKGLDGHGRRRTEFTQDMHRALDSLDVDNRSKVYGVAEFRGTCMTAVEQWFRS